MKAADLDKTSARLERKSFDFADEVREPYEKGRVDVLKVGNARQWTPSESRSSQAGDFVNTGRRS